MRAAGAASVNTAQSWTMQLLQLTGCRKTGSRGGMTQQKVDARISPEVASLMITLKETYSALVRVGASRADTISDFGRWSGRAEHAVRLWRDGDPECYSYRQPSGQSDVRRKAWSPAGRLGEGCCTAAAGTNRAWRTGVAVYRYGRYSTDDCTGAWVPVRGWACGRLRTAYRQRADASACRQPEFRAQVCSVAGAATGILGA